MAVVLYVDDIVIAGPNQQEISEVKSYLKSKFKVKDLGNLKYFLGLEITRSKSGILVTQR